MKKILGLDLGTTSIGWAYIKEAEQENEQSEILRLGVRVIPLTTDEERNFQGGKTITTNAERTMKRSARKNLDRYQLRRKNLIHILKKHNIITENTILSEDERNSTHSTYRLRSKAASDKIGLEDFAKVLLMVNKKRGYKSSRKINQDEEGTLIDGMEIAKIIYEQKLTPGQYVYNSLKSGSKYIPEFYRSDLINEFEKVYELQKQFYPDVLTDRFKEEIFEKGKKVTSAIFYKTYNITTVDIKGNREEKRLQTYKLRANAAIEKVSIEECAFALIEINNNLTSSSGYLGKISDRSKELYFNKQTVGQYQFALLHANKHTSLKNMVFYRQDYLDEFNTIWETQAKYHKELTPTLKEEIRDVVIFYQRRLKSQKHLISNCELEPQSKVIPRSSPLFQEFKIWSIINNIAIRNIETNEEIILPLEQKELLFDQLNISEKITSKELLKLLVNNPAAYNVNFEEIDGNKTNTAFVGAYLEILALEGVYPAVGKIPVSELMEEIRQVFETLGIDTDILEFKSDLSGGEYFKQPYYQLWHLLYSFEGDNSKEGNKNLLVKLHEKFGFSPEHAKIVSTIRLQTDYGKLSAKAIRKILPHLKEGNTYDKACMYENYRHSKSSLTKSEIKDKVLKPYLELLPKNSLRNPVVEKILNQMVNVINAIFKDPELGKPDEIRIELARELKSSAEERNNAFKAINKAKTDNEKIRKILKSEFGISKVTRNDIVRYKLYEELELVGYKDLYSGKYIAREKIFSKDLDIEHIIPKTKLFDDSFSNKTLSFRKDNIEKGNMTAIDYVTEKKSAEQLEQFKHKAETLFKAKKIFKAKYNKLLMKENDIPSDFIDRDLRDSQYIARKAHQMLNEIVRSVTSTTGRITDRLRTDWQLVNIMKEINLPKYRQIGLTKTIEGKGGQPEEQIIGWTKRNDHRHHAMDALTVAFTRPSHIQYLNNLNARSNKNSNIYAIENKELYKENGKILFKPPMPLKEFRTEAKKHIENILVSYKAKNKVLTKNKNRIKQGNKGENYIQEVSTPRGQLHNETIYGQRKFYKTKIEKVGIKFDVETVKKVANEKYRNALIQRLNQFNNDAKKAFGGANSLSKKPVYIDAERKVIVPEKVKLVWLESDFTIRKPVSPDLNIEKVVDPKIKKLLQERLVEYNNDKKLAFSTIDLNPIWLNQEEGISVKSVVISGVNNAEALHYKKDHHGRIMYDKEGKKLPVDFVNTGNNHHVAIYQDEEGKMHEEVVSFFEAVHRANAGLPVVNRNHNAEWKFLFTLKQNEYFVFPSDDFNPNEIDLSDPDNYSRISPHLFRVQKISTKNYVFNLHTETKAVDGDILKNKALAKNSFYFIQTPEKLKDIVKVGINHLGKIVKTGEY
jgi:CRISPR-associated endonuclease Csn1